jgi:hypothetical protein
MVAIYPDGKSATFLFAEAINTAQKEQGIMSKIKNTAASVKNKVLEMIAKVKDHKSRLDLPIMVP